MRRDQNTRSSAWLFTNCQQQYLTTYSKHERQWRLNLRVHIHLLCSRSGNPGTFRDIVINPLFRFPCQLNKSVKELRLCCERRVSGRTKNRLLIYLIPSPIYAYPKASWADWIFRYIPIESNHVLHRQSSFPAHLGSKTEMKGHSLA